MFSMTHSSDGEWDKGIQIEPFLWPLRPCSLVRLRLQPQLTGSWAPEFFTRQQSQFCSLPLWGSPLLKEVGWKSPLISSSFSTYLREPSLPESLVQREELLRLDYLFPLLLGLPSTLFKGIVNSCLPLHKHYYFI